MYRATAAALTFHPKERRLKEHLLGRWHEFLKDRSDGHETGTSLRIILPASGNKLDNRLMPVARNLWPPPLLRNSHGKPDGSIVHAARY